MFRSCVVLWLPVCISLPSIFTFIEVLALLTANFPSAYLSELTQENAVFVWLLATCGLSSTISWFSICATHIRFRKALQYQNVDEQIRRGIRLDELPFRSPWGVIGSYFVSFWVRH